MTEIFFTSDTHFGHKGVIEYCARPFSDVDEMDEVLIKNWNDRVSKLDRIYHLGDFSFRGQEATRRIIRRLNGQITLVRGNHDSGMTRETLNMFHEVVHLKSVRWTGGKVHLCHYPIESWVGMHRGHLHFHGHSHGNLKRVVQGRVDVGVDCWDYAPVHWMTAVKAASSGADPTADHH